MSRVEVRSSELHGSGLFTTTAVEAGDLLFEEAPFCWNYCGPYNPTICDQCATAVQGSAHNCSGCGVVYCSEECQSKALSTHHAFLCPYQAQLNALRDYDTNGHLGVAAKLLAMILQRVSGEAATVEAVRAAADDVLGRWSREHRSVSSSSESI